MRGYRLAVFLHFLFFVSSFVLSSCSGGFEKSANRSADNFSKVFRSTIWKPSSAHTPPVVEKQGEREDDEDGN